MADVYEYLIPTGVITTDTGAILTQVQNEYKLVFGQDLIVTPETPQGMWITSEALARAAVADNNAALANQINPNLAGGVFLDSILALTGSFRTPASSSTVLCNLTGVAGTLIPQGSQATESVSGSLFQSISSVTLGSDGTASVVFAAVETGAISAATNTLTQIVSDVLGWETITNPSAAVLGQSTQSDVSARMYRRNTLFAQGSSLAGAITSAIYAIPQVKSLSFRENVADTTETIDGVVMVPHSIYACVDGGSDIDVANALVSKKSGGCAYNNGASGDPITQPVVIPFSGQVMDILFDRPDIVQILVRATVKIDTSVQDPQTAVVDAILAYQDGEIDGETGLIVGMNVSCFELAGAVNSRSPGIYVQNMETSLVSGSFSNDEIPIAIWERANIQDSAITVVVL